MMLWAYKRIVMYRRIVYFLRRYSYQTSSIIINKPYHEYDNYGIVTQDNLKQFPPSTVLLKNFHWIAAYSSIEV